MEYDIWDILAALGNDRVLPNIAWSWRDLPENEGLLCALRRVSFALLLVQHNYSHQNTLRINNRISDTTMLSFLCQDSRLYLCLDKLLQLQSVYCNSKILQPCMHAIPYLTAVAHCK